MHAAAEFDEAGLEDGRMWASSDALGAAAFARSDGAVDVGCAVGPRCDGVAPEFAAPDPGAPGPPVEHAIPNEAVTTKRGKARDTRLRTTYTKAASSEPPVGSRAL